MGSIAEKVKQWLLGILLAVGEALAIPDNDEPALPPVE